ncbi:LPS biosynthesis protein RfbU [Sporosarcina sp. NCCP-2716]|uniref:glycosyltransferase n=1 Tax=Sporosarcina sp. NCCP-2716 TaxID=2943679 RepID=UPI0020418D5A|nr:glycosyltransferase [Sporosarcina sp. NCCP-2716]GKV69354.1 LPS biosynthesis protein RfbU [Sporosarcina sp. NCCP-2716]
MKKIAVFSNMYPTEAHPTYGIFVKNQVGLLRSAGVETDVIAITDPQGGKIRSLAKYGKWMARAGFYMMKNRKKLSLTHAHYAFPTGLLSLIGKRRFGIPYVVTVHGGDIDKMAKKSARIRRLTADVLRGADHVITVGERLKQELISDFGVAENRITVMSMGVDQSVFRPLPKAEVRQELGLPEDAPVLLFIGNIIREKGVLELVKAFAGVKERFPHASLHLIGSTRSAGYVGEVEQWIAGQKIADITFEGTKPQAELAKWLAAADVLALPSYHEGFGLVALEAMASGTQVVASDVGGLPYLLGDRAGILVPPREVESLTGGLLEALSGDTTDDSGKREAVVREHSYDEILGRLLSIYGEIGRT